MQTLYEKDVFAWGLQQIELLRNKEFDKLDIENLIDEVRSVAISDRRSLISHLACLLMHLLKMKYDPDNYCRSWELSVLHSKESFEDVLKDNPSMKPKLEEILYEAYKKAVKSAVLETMLPKSKFPLDCPWSLETALNWKQFKFGH